MPTATLKQSPTAQSPFSTPPPMSGPAPSWPGRSHCRPRNHPWGSQQSRRPARRHQSTSHTTHQFPPIPPPRPPPALQRLLPPGTRQHRTTSRTSTGSGPRRTSTADPPRSPPAPTRLSPSRTWSVTTTTASRGTGRWSGPMSAWPTSAAWSRSRTGSRPPSWPRCAIPSCAGSTARACAAACSCTVRRGRERPLSPAPSPARWVPGSCQ